MGRPHNDMGLHEMDQKHWVDQSCESTGSIRP
jgi:hypothetical protein